MLRAGRIVTKTELERLVLGFDAEVASNALEVHVSSLRRKLGRCADRHRARHRLPHRGRDVNPQRPPDGNTPGRGPTQGRPAGSRRSPGALSRALLCWGLLWGAVLAGAVWLAVRQEVDELLDDTLQAAAEGLVGRCWRPQPAAASAVPAPATPASGAAPGGRYAWQLVAHNGGAQVLRRSSRAPALPLQSTPSAGFADVPGWRVYGTPLGQGSRMIYVAQSRDERIEVQFEVALTVALASLPMGLLALLWLRARLRHELRPLLSLSDRLATLDPLLALAQGQTLGTAARAELQPVHTAIDALAAAAGPTHRARACLHGPCRARAAHAAGRHRRPAGGGAARMPARAAAAPATRARRRRPAAAGGVGAAGAVPQRRRAAAPPGGPGGAAGAACRWRGWRSR